MVLKGQYLVYIKHATPKEAEAAMFLSRYGTWVQVRRGFVSSTVCLDKLQQLFLLVFDVLTMSNRRVMDVGCW